MTVNRLLKRMLNVKGATISGAEFVKGPGGEVSLDVHAAVHKRDRWRCPVCGRKCNVHDYVGGERFWRGMDFGPVRVRIGATVPRVACPEHGVATAAVPWAKRGCRFTTDFAYSAAWMVKGGLSKKRVSEYLGIDWDTVGRLVDLVWHELEPDVKRRFDGLVRIGVDETSYRKGHTYITVVVNHDTNTVVWAHKGYGKEVLDLFFGELAEEQRASIRVVSGDGATWITESMTASCPNAVRCVDPFHVVEWANAALDLIRRGAWRRARDKLEELVRKAGGHGTSEAGVDPSAVEDIRKAKRAAEQIKNSRYALGKNPENLTARQAEKLSMIQAEDGPLARAHALKEQLRLIFKLKDPQLAEEYLDKWILRAQRSRVPEIVELQRKIRRNRESILNSIRYGVSNARIEATNNKIKLLIRVAYGFRNIDTMISLIMLFCSAIEIPLPTTESQMSIIKGRNAWKAA